MRVAAIRTCDDCPYFDNEDPDYLQKCELLKRVIDEYEYFGHKIPEDCPLDDASKFDIDIKYFGEQFDPEP